MKKVLLTLTIFVFGQIYAVTPIKAQIINETGSIDSQPSVAVPVPIDNTSILNSGETGLGGFFARNNRDLNAELAQQQNAEPMRSLDMAIEHKEFLEEQNATSTSTPRVGIDLTQ